MGSKRGMGIYFVLLILMLAMLVLPSIFGSEDIKSYNRATLDRDIESGQVADIVITPGKISPSGKAEITKTTGSIIKIYVTDVNEMEQHLISKGVTPYIAPTEQDSWFMNNLMPLLICVVLMMFMMSVMVGGGGAGSANSKMMNFGRSRAKMTTDSKISFKDVAGLDEEKEELDEIVDFLKDPGKYTELGARIPKGILMEGAPGTGKTLLAKAIAGEAKVPFFSISGSDFVEMFVGVGASRVRDLFEDAKKNAPCIVFIDEIDAVARRRGTGMGGGHDEREQTLNQLLVEMDGFAENSGIIVMAATNRVDILDPAIMRPGRFDRRITVNRPDVAGREAILEVHAKNKPLAEDVDLNRIARTTAGFTGADLENLLNESAIKAAREDRKYILQKDIEQSFIKIGLGVEKKSRVISEDERRITAYHESGHAILFHVLPKVDPVHIISIIPTGLGAGGFTMPLPDKDEMYMTKSRMEQDIMVSLGGRIAEELIFDDITTGASNDIIQATKRARSMVTKYGMSKELGMINYDDDQEEVFIGRDLAHAKTHSEAVSAQIDAEVKRIVDECYEKAKSIIVENMDILHKSANLLLEKEKIGREEFEALFVENAQNSTF